MQKIVVSILAVLVLGTVAPRYGIGTAVAAAGKAGSATLAAQQAQAITIQNFAFSPTSLTVTPGTTVTWTNNDQTAHTVTVNSGTGPNSGQIMPGQSYSFTFQQAGTYPYHCSIHPQMKATVIVAASQPAPSINTAPPSGAKTPQPPSAATPQPVAAGPVAAGSGSVATDPARFIPLGIGILALSAALGLLLIGRLRLWHR